MGSRGLELILKRSQQSEADDRGRSDGLTSVVYLPAAYIHTRSDSRSDRRRTYIHGLTVGLTGGVHTYTVCQSV